MIGYKQITHPPSTMECILKTCGVMTAKVIASDLLYQLQKSGRPLKHTNKWLTTQRVLLQIVHDIDNIEDIHRLVRIHFRTCCALRPTWEYL